MMKKSSKEITPEDLAESIYKATPIRQELVDAASPMAKRIIKEHGFWFKLLYLEAVLRRREPPQYVLSHFWRDDWSQQGRPKFWIPEEVISELIHIAQKSHSMAMQERKKKMKQQQKEV